MAPEIISTRRVLIQKSAVDPVIVEKDFCHAVEKRLVRLGREWQMPRCGNRRLGAARVNDDNRRPMWIAKHSLPKNRVTHGAHTEFSEAFQITNPNCMAALLELVAVVSANTIDGALNSGP